VILCVCTDSIPTDAEGKEHPLMIQEFLSTLQQLVEWPVQVVLRLSTDEERVVNFYQNLMVRDESLSNHLQVLDDYVSECQLVQHHNPWLHYGYPLHLCREEGIRIPVLEALNQRPLLPNEMCDVVSLIFGYIDQSYNPDREYAEFRKQVLELNKETGVLWNPTKKKFVTWMDLKKLDKLYHHQLRKSPSEKCIIS
jgi:hypothetical protein